MKILIIEPTVCKGKDVFPEDVVDIEDHEARKLIRLGKAEPVDGAGSEGGEEITLDALKRLKKAKLIETVNREFDLDVDDGMTKGDILDLAEAAIDEQGA